MIVGEICKRLAVSINSNLDVVEAAKLMREKHVGFLVVLSEGDEARKPIGVLTDRDIVLQVTARDVSAREVTVADVMTRQPLIAREGDTLREALQAMRLAGIRRVPVVDVRGSLTGIIAIDDAVDVMSSLLCDIAYAIKNEQSQEWRVRPEVASRPAS